MESSKSVWAHTQSKEAIITPKLGSVQKNNKHWLIRILARENHIMGISIIYVYNYSIWKGAHKRDSNIQELSKRTKFKRITRPHTIPYCYPISFCTRGKQGHYFAITSQDSPIVWKQPGNKHIPYQVLHARSPNKYWPQQSLPKYIQREVSKCVYTASQCKRNEVKPDCSLLTTGKQSEVVIKD